MIKISRYTVNVGKPNKHVLAIGMEDAYKSCCCMASSPVTATLNMAMATCLDVAVAAKPQRPLFLIRTTRVAEGKEPEIPDYYH